MSWGLGIATLNNIGLTAASWISFVTVFCVFLEFTGVAAISAKSLGTLAMVYAIGELQIPLPSRKIMLCDGDMNSPTGRSDAFLHS